jgi:integrase
LEIPLGPIAFQDCFKQVLIGCGLPADLNVHMLRNTFTFLWLYDNKDIEGLSRALGHDSVEETRNRYASFISVLNIFTCNWYNQPSF